MRDTYINALRTRTDAMGAPKFGDRQVARNKITHTALGIGCDLAVQAGVTEWIPWEGYIGEYATLYRVNDWKAVVRWLGLVGAEPAKIRKWYTDDNLTFAQIADRLV